MELLIIFIIFIGLAFALWCCRDYVNNFSEVTESYQDTIDMINARKRQTEARMDYARQSYANIDDLYGATIHQQSVELAMIDVTPKEGQPK